MLMGFQQFLGKKNLQIYAFRLDINKFLARSFQPTNIDLGLIIDEAVCCRVSLNNASD